MLKILKNLVILVSLLFLCSCNTTSFVRIHGQQISIEIADTPQKYERGLMGRTSLAPNHGMFFAFAEDEQPSFWMKNTRIPLDILFIQQDGTITQIETMPSCTVEPCPTFTSEFPIRYALEVRAHYAEEKKIVVGDVVEHLPSL